MAEDEQEPHDSARPEVIGLYEQGYKQKDIAEEVGVSESWVSRVVNEYKEEKAADEEVERMITGEAKTPTPDEVYDELDDFPGIGEKKAKAMHKVLKKRPAILEDPRAFYELANQLLNIDPNWLENLVYTLYPQVDPVNQQGQPQQGGVNPIFGQNGVSNGGLPQGLRQPQGHQQPQQQQHQMPWGNQHPVQQGQPQQGGGNQAAILQQMQRQFQQQVERLEGELERLREEEEQTERERLLERMEEMERRMEERITQQNGQAEDDMVSQVKQLAEMRQVLEELTGGDDEDSEEIRQLQRQLQQMAQYLEQGGGGGGGNLDLSSVSSDLQALLVLAQQGDIDSDTVGTLVSEFGAVKSDPELAEKEYDFKIKQKELEQTRERWDKITDALSDVAGTLTSAAVNAAGGGSDAAAEATERDQHPPPAVEREPEPERDAGSERPTVRARVEAEQETGVSAGPGIDAIANDVIDQHDFVLEEYAHGNPDAALEFLWDQTVGRMDDDADIDPDTAQQTIAQTLDSRAAEAFPPDEPAPEPEPADVTQTVTRRESVEPVDETVPEEPDQPEPEPPSVGEPASAPEPEPAEPEYVCPNCGKEFTDHDNPEMALRGHMNAHTDEKDEATGEGEGDT